ncbi:L-lactate utilization protein LutC, contains LUD domain [Paenibacillaceae bacterium GAS479]|nr:L-lactate utilization protein LutC, contains LUD domain [Paenibacillaceae bacterium GAS479]
MRAARLRSGREMADMADIKRKAVETAEQRRLWLQELEQKSMKRQGTFMDSIAAKLGRPRQLAKPEQPHRGAPELWRSFEWSEEERVERFRQYFTAAGGHVEQLPDMAAASQFIAAKARDMKARRVLRQDQPELAALGLEAALPEQQVRVWNRDAFAEQAVTDGGEPGVSAANEAERLAMSQAAASVANEPERLDASQAGASVANKADRLDTNQAAVNNRERWLAHAAEADFGVVLADHAVAYTASVVVKSAAYKGRSVSLLPTVLFVIIPRDRLKTRLGEVLQPLDEAGRAALPAGIHFISGPSRSADIENDLTIGVHGPGIVYALLIG